VDAIGVADFSEAHLSRLHDIVVAHSNSATDPKSAIISPIHSSSSDEKRVASLKFPAVDQLTFDDDLPQSMIFCAKKKNIALVSHSDALGD
jgi:hypothetical protein